MTVASWSLDPDERRVLAAALDALLPAEGSFPWPSTTGVIDDFIIPRVPHAGDGWLPYPGLDATSLKAILARLATSSDMTAALAQLEREDPALFVAFWRLAVYGYYSRREVIAAIQHDLAPAYHGAPQPLGYAHVIPPWDPADALQRPRHPRGSYRSTADVQRIDLTKLPPEQQ